MPIYIPTFSSHSPQHCYFLFGNSHSDRYKWYLIVVWFAFSWWSVILSIFSYVRWLSMSSLGKHLFRSFAQFLIRLLVSLMLSRMSSLYNLDINLLSDKSFANIFSYSIGCLFILLIVSFVVQKLFSLKRSHRLFCFCLPSLRIYIQKTFVRPMSKVYCQCFLLVIWGLLCFHRKFRITCSSSVKKKKKKSHWYFDRDCTEFIDYLGGYDHFNKINSSNPWAWYIIPFVHVILNLSKSYSFLSIYLLG